jgi:hypothetical protein
MAILHFVFCFLSLMIRSVLSNRMGKSSWFLFASSSASTTNSTSTTGSSVSTIHKIDDDFNKFHKVNDEVVFSGWRKIVRRKLQFPNGSIKDFDILNTATSIVVFNWDSRTKTTTLIQEYHPGIEKALYGTVAGMYEDHKHSDPLECAQFELEEEAHLRSSKWIPLLNNDNATVSLDKYSDNKFHAYLAIDCEKVANPREIDEEEYIVIKDNISYNELMQLISSGQMNVLSSYASLMAIQKLKELGLPLE